MKINKPKCDSEVEFFTYLKLKFDGILNSGEWNEDDITDIEPFVKNIKKQARQEGIEEAIKLSDEIEAGKETTLEEWKAFKCFRNTLRDRYELKKKEGVK